MKKIAASLIFLATCAIAHADPVLMMSMKNQAGGVIAMFRGATECATGIGVIATLPFTGDLPGCVTRLDKDSVHVYFMGGSERDYAYASWKLAN